MWPTVLYHRTEPPVTVTSEDDRDARLANGWADTPAAFYEPLPRPKPMPWTKKKESA